MAKKDNSDGFDLFSIVNASLNEQNKALSGLGWLKNPLSGIYELPTQTSLSMISVKKKGESNPGHVRTFVIRYNNGSTYRLGEGINFSADFFEGGLSGDRRPMADDELDQFYTEMKEKIGNFSNKKEKAIFNSDLERYYGMAKEKLPEERKQYKNSGKQSK